MEADMSIFQVLGCGFLVLVLWLVLQQYKSSVSVFVVTAFGAIVFLNIAGQLQNVLQTLMRLSEQAGVNVIYLTTVFKIIGIAWLTEFFCQVCRDAGSSALAVKVEFAAKVAILLLAFPVLTAVLESITAIL
ncbi:MAG: stage III sporulation protein AD [Peptococcaceae bacterium]|nr:stage III sporulation protein AD [Peptococcaceae bacterium]